MCTDKNLLSVKKLIIRATIKRQVFKMPFSVKSGLSLSSLAEALGKSRREKLLEGYDLKNFVKVFEDRELMSTLNSLFENDLNVSKTARALFMHRNTLIYRLNKVRSVTGLDPCSFGDAVTLLILLALYRAK